jgi:uncharacterized protein
MNDSLVQPVPMSDAIAFADDGRPYLSGLRCGACGEITPGRRMACPKCASARELEPAELGDEGTIFAWTIVNRSFPGVPVPLISAVVAMSSGAHLRGNIEELPAEPEAVAACSSVRVKFAKLAAADGTELIRYYFTPTTGEQQ